MASLKRKNTTNGSFIPHLKSVKKDAYYIQRTIYKTKDALNDGKFFEILTDCGKKMKCDVNNIINTSISASDFESTTYVTKTEMIELFNSIAVLDIWTATFSTLSKDKKWCENFVNHICSMQKSKAIKYVESNISNVNKATRVMIGKKLNCTSNNNMYLVRDLEIYFKQLSEKNDVEAAEKNSIRNVDVNSISALIYNNVQYLKKK